MCKSAADERMTKDNKLRCGRDKLEVLHKMKNVFVRTEHLLFRDILVNHQVVKRYHSSCANIQVKT